MTGIAITRAGPLCTVQDAGRFGMLRHGVSASGPMDLGAYERAGLRLGRAGTAAIEFTGAGLGFAVEGDVTAAFDGGHFRLNRNGRRLVVVVMGGESAKSRNAHVEELIVRFLPAARPGV